MDFLKNEKTLCFLGGLAATVVGGKVLKWDKTRKACVKSLAKGMKFQQDAKEVFQNMKEEAEDICYDAKQEAQAARASEE